MFCPYCGEKILASKSGSEKEPSNSSGNNSGGSSGGGSGYTGSGYNGGSGYASSGYNGGSGYASSGYNGGSGYAGSGYSGGSGYAGSGYNGGSGDSGYGGSGSSSSGTNSSDYNSGSGYAGSGYSSGGSGDSGYSGSGYSSGGSGDSGYSGSGYNSGGSGDSGYSGSGYNSGGSGDSGYSGSGYSSSGSGDSGYSGSGYNSGGSSYNSESGYGFGSGGSGGSGFGGGPDIANSSFEKRTDPPKLRGTGTVERMIHLGSGLVGFAPLIGMFFSLIMSLATHVIAGYIFRSYGAFVVFGFVKQIILVACLVIVVGILIGAFYLVMTGRTAQEQEFIIVLIASFIAVVYFVLLLLNKLMPLRIVLIIADLVLGIDLVAKLVTYGTGLCGNFNLAESVAVLQSRSVERQARSAAGNTGSGDYGSAAAGGAAAYTYSSLPSNENGPGGPGGPGSYGPQGGAPYPDANRGGSYFDGTGGELVGLLILTVLVSLITCGIATPWFLCKIYRWQKEHTVIDGKRLTFNGSGAELLGKWIIWEVLSAITCGLYGFYMAVALKKWELSHTAYMGTQDIGGMPYQGSQFDGSFASYIGNRVLCNFLTSITCGIAYPWASVPLIKWEYTGSVVCRDRLGYFGNGSDMFKIYIINMLLTYITCGIYAPWAICRINRYICSNVHVIHRY